MIKQGDKIEITVTSLGSNGEGVANCDGYTVFVPFVLVGERALVRVTYVKKSVAYAVLDKLLEKSVKRVNAPCKYFGLCGGCALQHMDDESEALFKQNKVKNNLLKIGGMDVNVLSTFTGKSAFDYRNKLSLPVGGRRGDVKIGMYKRDSHVVVDEENCLLAPWAKTLVCDFKNYLNKQGVVPYDERTFKGEIRHLVARFVDGQLLVTVVSNGVFRHNLAPFVDSLKKHFDVFGLFVNENTNKNNVILGEKTTHIFGIEYIESEHFGVKFRLRPNSFFQVNNEVKNALYSKAKELLDTAETEVLVDLFSGIGILTCALASENYDTFAVEIEPSAVKDANEMKQLNGISRLTNICGDAVKELPQIVEKCHGKKMSLVVDPPRKGLGETICETVLDGDFNSIVYISCDSATLARDLKLLSAKYAVTYCQPFNMFPKTDQVETLVCLTRKTNE